MTKILAWFGARSAVLAFAAIATETVQAQPAPGLPALNCDATAQRSAVQIDSAGGPVQLAAGQRFERALPHGWRIVLEPAEHGWYLQLPDRPERSGAVDLSAVTPPLYGMNNPRFLLGWHFRNQANSGPNTGDVNAPQNLRLFEFEPELIGTGGYRPSDNSDATPAPGRGWLRIESFELTPPSAGEQASFEQIGFRACVTWPAPDPADEQRWLSALEASRESLAQTQLAFDETDIEIMGSCGMPLNAYELDARFTPRMLQLDIDGDDALDTVMQARRVADGQYGVALCRAGTWFDWLGPQHEVAADADVELTLTALEAWRVVDRDNGPMGYVDEPPWPQMSGQALILERLEKSMVAVYWWEDSLRTHRVYRFIEP